MNSCILMVQIVKSPELRYTPDNLALAEMLVEFAGVRAEEPPATLKTIAWGNLAQEVQERYHEGDRLIIEGRLHMNTIERPDNTKEKRAELVASRIHPLEANVTLGVPASVATPDNAPISKPSTPTAPKPEKIAFEPQTAQPASEAIPSSSPAPIYSGVEKDLDEIPF
jgi:single-stranded DNA-binding protein